MSQAASCSSYFVIFSDLSWDAVRTNELCGLNLMSLIGPLWSRLNWVLFKSATLNFFNPYPKYNDTYERKWYAMHPVPLVHPSVTHTVIRPSFYSRRSSCCNTLHLPELGISTEAEFVCRPGFEPVCGPREREAICIQGYTTFHSTTIVNVVSN